MEAETGLISQQRKPRVGSQQKLGKKYSVASSVELPKGNGPAKC